MPELGKYALEVTGSYVATFVVLAVLIVATFHKSRKVQKQLAEAERQAAKNA